MGVGHLKDEEFKYTTYSKGNINWHVTADLDANCLEEREQTSFLKVREDLLKQNVNRIVNLVNMAESRVLDLQIMVNN